MMNQYYQKGKLLQYQKDNILYFSAKLKFQTTKNLHGAGCGESFMNDLLGHTVTLFYKKQYDTATW